MVLISQPVTQKFLYQLLFVASIHICDRSRATFLLRSAVRLIHLKGATDIVSKYYQLRSGSQFIIFLLDTSKERVYFLEWDPVWNHYYLLNIGKTQKLNLVFSFYVFKGKKLEKKMSDVV